jgi:predicted transcriptional regulator
MSTMTLNLDDKHMVALDELATAQDMTKTQIIRQALRLYQHVHQRYAKGEEMAFTKDGVIVPVVIVGLAAFD